MIRFTLILSAALLLSAGVVVAQQPVPRILPPEYSRIVLLGDSITDGLTYQLLLEQALMEAGFQKPVLMNAGVGGDTAKGMGERVERDVLSRNPTTVLLSCGINDAREVAPADFRESVVSIIEQLRAKNVRIILLQPSMVRPFDFSKVDRTKLSPEQIEDLEANEAEAPVVLGRLTGYRIILRQLAKQYSLPLADIDGAMQKVYANGVDQWEDDGTHLSFAGYRTMVRAVLDALNLPDIAVPAVAKIHPAPGIFKQWQVRALPENSVALDEKSIAEVRFDGDWQKLILPMPKVQDHWYWEQARQRGVALDLNQTFKASIFWASTTFDIKKPQSLYLNTGASVSSVWLRKTGEAWKPVWKNPGGALGWHATPRVRLDFTPGEYSLLAETGSQFFISLTTDDAM